MKKNCLIIFLCLSSSFLRAQNSHATNRKGDIFVGTSSGGLVVEWRDQTTWERYWIANLVFQPRVGFFISDRMLISLQGEIDMRRSNLGVSEEFYGLGFLSRCYPRLPSFISSISLLERKVIQDRMIGFVEVGGLFLNSYDQNGTTIPLPSLGVLELQSSMGVNIRVWRNFFFETTLLYLYSPSNLYSVNGIPFKLRIGLDIFLSNTK